MKKRRRRKGENDWRRAEDKWAHQMPSLNGKQEATKAKRDIK